MLCTADAECEESLSWTKSGILPLAHTTLNTVTKNMTAFDRTSLRQHPNKAKSILHVWSATVTARVLLLVHLLRARMLPDHSSFSHTSHLHQAPLLFAIARCMHLGTCMLLHELSCQRGTGCDAPGSTAGIALAWVHANG